MNDKILFVTSRNILTTSGELRLIKNRAEAIKNNHNICTDFLVWQSKERINSDKREVINAGGEIFTVALGKNIFSSFKHLKKEFKRKLASGEYSIVVFSGLFMTSLIKYAKKYPKIKTGIDIHGASEDILFFAKDKGFKSKLKARMMYSTDKHFLKKNFKKANFTFVVTESLKDYVIEKFKPSKEIKFLIAPCATSGELFDKNEYDANRKKYREKYGLKDNDTVFVYSGGVSKWQCIDKTIELINKISKQVNNPKFLIFSHNIEYIKSLAKDNNNIIFDSFSPSELEKALCAADYAFLLRENCVTNNVAFPNKYLEYVKSGLKIISTPYLYEIAKQISDYKIGYIYDFEEDITNLVDFVNGDKNVDEEIINEVLKINGFENRLKSFKEILN